MATILKTKSLYYNDVNLIARPAHPSITSRKLIPQEKHRIIVSPMDAIVGLEFVKEAAKNGISVILPRLGKTRDIKSQIGLVDEFNQAKHPHGANFCYPSLGLKDFETNLDFILEETFNGSFCLDLASGYLNFGKQFDVLATKRRIDTIVVGNVHTIEGVRHLIDFKKFCNTLIIRVNLGGGKICETSDFTGVNRGNITEIIECSGHSFEDTFTCGDGGVSKPANACKAFAAGADFVMMGGYFAKAIEAKTNIDGDGTYWGGASQKQLDICGIKEKHPEGRTMEITDEKLPLKKLVDDLWGGISSYVSYSGYPDLTSAIGNGIFEVKENSLPPKSRH